LAVGFDPKNLEIASKLMALLDSGGAGATPWGTGVAPAPLSRAKPLILRQFLGGLVPPQSLTHAYD